MTVVLKIQILLFSERAVDLKSGLKVEGKSDCFESPLDVFV